MTAPTHIPEYENKKQYNSERQSVFSREVLRVEI